MRTIRHDDHGFVVTADGPELPASGIVAASGSFSKPHRPKLVGGRTFTGKLSPSMVMGSGVVAVTWAVKAQG